MKVYGTEGTGLCDPNKMDVEENDCTDTGDKIPDGEGIDSKKNLDYYLHTYGTNNNG